MLNRITPLVLVVAIAAATLTGCGKDDDPDAVKQQDRDADDPARVALVHDATVMIKALDAAKAKDGRLPVVPAIGLPRALDVELTAPDYVHTYVPIGEDPAFCLANDDAGVWLTVPVRTGIVTDSGSIICDGIETP